MSSKERQRQQQQRLLARGESLPLLLRLDETSTSSRGGKLIDAKKKKSFFSFGGKGKDDANKKTILFVSGCSALVVATCSLLVLHFANNNCSTNYGIADIIGMPCFIDATSQYVRVYNKETESLTSADNEPEVHTHRFIQIDESPYTRLMCTSKKSHDLLCNLKKEIISNSNNAIVVQDIRVSDFINILGVPNPLKIYRLSESFQNNPIAINIELDNRNPNIIMNFLQSMNSNFLHANVVYLKIHASKQIHGYSFHCLEDFFFRIKPYLQYMILENVNWFIEDTFNGMKFENVHTLVLRLNKVVLTPIKKKAYNVLLNIIPCFDKTRNLVLDVPNDNLMNVSRLFIMCHIRNFYVNCELERRFSLEKVRRIWIGHEKFNSSVVDGYSLFGKECYRHYDGNTLFCYFHRGESVHADKNVVVPFDLVDFVFNKVKVVIMDCNEEIQHKLAVINGQIYWEPVKDLFKLLIGALIITLVFRYLLDTFLPYWRFR